MKPKFRLAAIALLSWVLLACGHETKSALEKLEADKTMADDKAVVEMAKASFMHSSGDSEKFSATKKGDALLLTGMTKDTLALTNLDKDNFRQIEMGMDAKYMWRLFRSGTKRGLTEMVFTHKQALSDGSMMDLYRVRLTLAQLKGISGWDTADPYSTGEHDVLDTEAAKSVVKSVVKTWTVELDNIDKLDIQ